MNIREEFQIHDTLNKKLWDIQTNKLLPEVRQKIIEICASFEDYIRVPIEILDIQLVGSNASFNYTETSDLDVHLICNFEVLGKDDAVLKAYYETKKSQFNKETDITIRGIAVEMYVQDVRSTVASNGIYSVCDDEWVKEPKPIKSATKHNTEKEVQKWSEVIQNVLSKKDYDEINKTLSALYLMRTNSIAVDGEQGKGNQIFKDLRSLGYINNLKEALLQSLSKELSLESLITKGQLINRLDD